VTSVPLYALAKLMAFCTVFSKKSTAALTVCVQPSGPSVFDSLILKAI
jgi:hypothetical protein